ncbi:hypothetical protein KPL70_003335 [Citrus sinensis]|uniref:uncharacterized protein LOC107175849 n=1 Tax=Citrus sinensis TaxID=2711 RepID=UPI0007638992|nr:uncharacterized protein LOC107175849 [Citrus sinensis]XP_024046542.1 uncharacterized protein LOC112100905 [Citrus x clementina]KAH9743528.1 hypothetical protein KPL70_003335 [Citrus sinensis]
MATAFLHSQDCLRNFRSSPRFNKPPPGPNPTPKPVPNLFSNRLRRKRRSGDDQSRSLTVIKLPSQNNLVIGRVKILKHDEAVLPPSLIKKEDASEKQIAVCSSNVESDNVDFFAGTAFSSSPPPSAVPLPRFLPINVSHASTCGLV